MQRKCEEKFGKEVGAVEQFGDSADSAVSKDLKLAATDKTSKSNGHKEVAERSSMFFSLHLCCHNR